MTDAIRPPRPTAARTGVLLAIASPFLFGVGGVLARYASVATTPESIVRSLVVVSLISGISLIVARVLTRSWHWAGMLAAGFVLFNLSTLLLLLPLAAFLVWWPLMSSLRRRRGSRPPDSMIPQRVARAVGVVSVVYFAVIGLSAAQAFLESTPEATVPRYDSQGSGGPNVYVLLLDGYPRQDTLSDVFEADNAQFLTELEGLGFDVLSDSRSNYPKTWQTMASMLNGAYVDDLLDGTEPPASAQGQLRWLHWLIDRAAVLDPFRDRGYTIRTLPAAYRSTALTSADEVIDHGGLNDFEARLIWQSPWMAWFPDWVGGLLLSAQEDDVRRNLAGMVELAESGSRPQFVLSHVHSPHPPFVLGQDPSAEDCFPYACSLWHVTIEELGISFEEYRSKFLPQVTELNQLVLQALNDVTAADPEGIVIVMSDHGARYSLEDTDEHYRSLLAVRAPGHPGLFAHDQTNVNILRDVVREYFGVDAPRLPDQLWSADWLFPLQMEPREDAQQ